MAVVVVESPAKARTIEKYLGKGFKVLASYGHVRDLPSKDGSVRPEEGFAMDWEVDSKSQKRLRDISDAIKDDPKLILATDPDREGEAISWHLLEALRKRRALKKDTPVERVVFNAITKAAVSEAMQNPRQVDMELVEAYLARRALDYLVGFTLSPVLWRKLPGAKSAGRVQSVALRLIVEREMEIEAFESQEYWSVKVALAGMEGNFEARLTVLDSKKLGKFDLGNETDAQAAVAAIEARDFTVISVEAKPATRNPAPPFMTSTLQQEASRKLGFGAQHTMRVAQKLYESGIITYMRTDGLDMAPEAIQEVRGAIQNFFNAAYVPSKPRVYKSKSKNAQEAHECIRPTDFSRIPSEFKGEKDEKRLYELIWKRAVASQMAAARFERTSVDISSPDEQVHLRATGQVITFDGFLKLYMEGRDDEEEEDSKRLPALKEGEALAKKAVTPEQHFTQPPPRYTEASLVKRLEELGIGRPSTYASIIGVVQDRGYVLKDKNRLIPEDKGRLVTAFLENYFSRLVQYDFTANLEDQLDEITSGKVNWKAVLEDFWRRFSSDVDATKDLRVSEVLDRINEVLGPYLFPEKEGGGPPRACPTCELGLLSVKTGRFGAFVGCSNYPDCRFTRQFGSEGEPTDAQTASAEGRLLGQDENGLEVCLKTGRFGPYVQRAAPEGGKAQNGSIPKGVAPDDVTLELALRLLSLPRLVGAHPEDGEPIEAAIGRYGPYVKHGSTYANLSDAREVFEVGLNRAVALLAEKKANPGSGRAAAKPPIAELGEHPAEGGKVQVLDGRYGPYVKWAKVNATIPKNVDPKSVTMEMAVELIKERQAKKKKR